MAKISKKSFENSQSLTFLQISLITFLFDTEHGVLFFLIIAPFAVTKGFINVLKKYRSKG